MQLVVGPPGSGKSTYCHGMQQFLTSLGRYADTTGHTLTRSRRRPILVNLDPANENIPYDCDVNIAELVTVEQVMAEHGLGPNGALLYCMEELERSVEWLLTRLEAAQEELAGDGETTGYFIFDLPGQVELSTCHEALVNTIRVLNRRNFRLAVVSLSDAAYCIDPMKFISLLTITLLSMMRLECPQVNVLSKIDLVGSYGRLPLRLEYYTEVQDLRHLLVGLDSDRIGRNYHRLNEALCELVEEASLVSFVPLAVEDKDCMAFLLGEIDKANGYVFGGLTPGNESIMEVAVRQAHRENLIELVKERYTASGPDDDSRDTDN